MLGRANVGKSTLVNALVGARVAIVSRRPQSTRRRMLGIANRAQSQIVLADSPGIHESAGRTLNRALNGGAAAVASAADILLFVSEAGRWESDDTSALELVRSRAKPVVLALNKIDRIRPRSALLPLIEEAARRYTFSAIVPIAARRGENVGRLAETLEPLLPVSRPLFPGNEVSDQSPEERVTETVREALIERVGEELPYATYVRVERQDKERGRVTIEATIWVARESQKGIVVGSGGRMVKAIGMAARRRLEAELGAPVMLRLWVRVHSDWNEDTKVLASLGLLA